MYIAVKLISQNQLQLSDGKHELLDQLPAVSAELPPPQHALYMRLRVDKQQRFR